MCCPSISLWIYKLKQIEVPSLSYQVYILLSCFLLLVFCVGSQITQKFLQVSGFWYLFVRMHVISALSCFLDRGTRTECIFSGEGKSINVITFYFWYYFPSHSLYVLILVSCLTTIANWLVTHLWVGAGMAVNEALSI